MSPLLLDLDIRAPPRGSSTPRSYACNKVALRTARAAFADRHLRVFPRGCRRVILMGLVHVLLRTASFSPCNRRDLMKHQFWILAGVLLCSGSVMSAACG